MQLESDSNRYDDDVDERRAIMEAEGVKDAKWRALQDAKRNLLLESLAERLNG